MKRRDYISYVTKPGELKTPIHKVKSLLITGVIPVQYVEGTDQKVTQDGDYIVIPYYKFDNKGVKGDFDYFHVVYIAKALENGKYTSEGFNSKMKENIKKIMSMDCKELFWKDILKEIVKSGLIIFNDAPRNNDDDDKLASLYLKKPSKRQLDSLLKLLDELAAYNYICSLDILTDRGEWESFIEKTPTELQDILQKKYPKKDNNKDNSEEKG